ncbi:MAG: alpha-2-macroglobulin family protein, partial [Anaerolineae bacterium]
GSFRAGYVKLPVNSESKELKVEIISDKDTYQPREQAAFTIRATDWMGRPVQAEFSIGLIDKAVLALGGPAQGLMKDAFWHERGLGITTAGSMVVSINVGTVMAMPAEKGGKGGGGGMEGMDMFVRTEFPDTAYWNPMVMTDANGQAAVSMTLPDNLTTWRLDARGITTDTRVGIRTRDVVATLPLMARPVLPRFFVIGDEVEISCIVHNNTDVPASVQVGLNADGIETADQLQRTVDVPAQGLQKLSWRVRVQSVEQARIRFTAEGGGLRDAVEHVLPVYHPSTPEVVATAGQLDAKGERVEAVVLPAVLDPSMGELTVTVDPSLAAGMRDGLKYVEEYPYECIEQTVSRFLPDVFTYRALQSLGIRNAELEEKLPSLVNTALQKLYAAQRFNGGWGWWIRDDPDDYLTAYVLFGLTEAARAGFPVDQEVMGRAARYIRERQYSIRTTTNVWQINREVFKLYVLANYDEQAGADATQELSRAVLLFEHRAKMGTWAKALLANALGMIDPGQQSRVDTLLAEIYSQAILSATGAHWEETYQDYRNMNTDARTTAIVLSALARYDRDNPLAGNAVRWLMSVRKEGRWESTYETVWALLGLTDWMVATGELEGDYSYAVDVNGNVIAQGKVTQDNIDEQVEARVAIADLMLDQANRLLITRRADAGQSDKGRLYYTAHLKYYLPAEEVKALSRGVIVSREYRLADAPDTPITEAKVGDVIQVRLTIIAPNDLHYVVLEDPLPAGCEAIDTSLEITSATMEPPRLEQVEKQKGPWWKWWWYGWWSPTHTELRDEKVVLFATYLAKGTYQYTYLIRASLPGSFQVLPATAYEMYFPEVFGRSDGQRFPITR